MNIIKQFWGSILFTVLSLSIALYYGFVIGGVSGAIVAFTIVALLCLAEGAVSMDNAIWNAKIIQNWSPFWQTLFLTVGIFFATIVVRAFFPLAIVSVAADLSILESFRLATTDIKQYSHILHDVHYLIAGYGGSFLLLVIMNFFFEEKEVYWLEWIEKKIEFFGKIDSFSIIFVLLLGYVMSNFTADPSGYFMACFWGVVTYATIQMLGGLLSDEGSSSKFLTGSIISLIYIEIIDASLSFDSVLVGLSITTNILYLSLGLFSGALLVRSGTIYLVRQGTLAKYEYLQHGAALGIGALAIIMLLSAVGIQTSEVIAGLIGISFIILSIWKSQKEKSKLLLG